MKSPVQRPPVPPARPAAFTLVELLVALAILSAAMAIAWGALSVSLSAWRRGDDLLTGLRRGESAADDLAMALRSAFFLPSEDGRYGFTLEPRAGDPPADAIRWTSLGGAGAAADAGAPGMPRRLTFAIERDEEDRPRAVLRAAPSFVEPDEGRPDPIVRAWPDIVGFACRAWNPTNEIWEAEWTNTNSIPVAVEIALYAAAESDAEAPTAVRRRIALPLASALDALARDRRAPRSRGGGAPGVRGGAARPDGVPGGPP